MEHHLVIGTAGHVDHGKTVLIKALTGVDTDRLREEKERGISIDLGFAPLRLPGGRLAGVVDVPGHQRFIHNMLAGAAGIDLVLLVVDATEGVMPQTREHLDILELLQLRKGIVAVTKMDLVEPDWLDLVEEEIREELAGSFLDGAPIQAVSAFTGAGLPELVALIDRVIREMPYRDTGAPLRLPVDRSFSVPGFGTVVTGTLLQGKVRAGDTVALVPPGISARVRQLQVHDTGAAEAGAGQRVALNLAGLEHRAVPRGSVVSVPGFYRPTTLLDAALTLLPAATRPLKNLDRVHFYLGTARVTARIMLLEMEELAPGRKSPAQFRLERPLVADRGDRFIIRSYSPMTTIGGGLILDPFPKRHRRFRRDLIEHLCALEEESLTGDGRAFLLQKIREQGPVDRANLEKVTRMSSETLDRLLEKLFSDGLIERLGGSYIEKLALTGWEKRLLEKLACYHRDHPLRAGLSRAELRGALPSPVMDREYDALLERLKKRKQCAFCGELVSLFGWSPAPSPKDSCILEQLEQIYFRGELQPPSRRAAEERVSLEVAHREEYFDFLVTRGDLVKINEEFYLHQEAYRKALALLRQYYAEEETLTLAHFRDLTGSSRKFIQPLLEYFDQLKLTRRIGDHRVAWKVKNEG